FRLDTPNVLPLRLPGLAISKYGKRPFSPPVRIQLSSCSTTVSHGKVDALSKRQFAGVVYGICGPAHIRSPCIGARFAAAAGFFLAAKGSADLRSRCSNIDVNDAAIRALVRDEPLCFRLIRCESIGRQCLWVFLM